MRGRLIKSGSIDFHLLEHWLRSCHDRHQECCIIPPSSRIVSLKLIDCITGRIEAATEDCKYAALSYVWGKQKVGALESQCGTFLPDQLPRTIEDAITVTKALGLRYLWIDRYCIPQSDEKERHNQIRQMDLIYSGAYLTIVAAAGQDPDFGLPGVSSTHRIPQCHVQIGSHILCSLMEYPSRVISRSTWASRAWTFQEAIFSKRRLIFTDQQVSYECQTTTWSETVDFEKDRSSDRLFRQEDLTRYPWEIYCLIAKYSSRMLSYDEDVLRAFYGVFRIFETAKHPVCHYWGIPVLPRVNRGVQGDIIPPPSVSLDLCQGFATGLCWLTKQPGKRRIGFPSWSWTGWTNRVEYYLYSCSRGLRAHAKIALEISVELRSGEIKDWDAFWQSHRLHADKSLLTTYLHIKSWTIPLQLESATRDPTKVGAYDDATLLNSKQDDYVDLFIFLYLAQIVDKDCDLHTNLQTHPLIGIILGNCYVSPDRSPMYTLVLVAQQKESSYECIGHMIFRYKASWSTPEASHRWKLRVPNMDYPFRHKSIQRIRLG